MLLIENSASLRIVKACKVEQELKPDTHSPMKRCLSPIENSASKMEKQNEGELSQGQGEGDSVILI